MAAKQGLTAHLSQAGEDAKRAVLSRTGVTSSSWFSNLNTVCTIKSAPPRTPEVLQMLAAKSGWLFKRNEQHVWQPRWCCVVPHMFLYYFDANIVPTPPLPNPTQQQQDEWNAAVLQCNAGKRKQHEKRSNFSLFTQPTPSNQAKDSSNSSHGNGANHSGATNSLKDPPHHHPVDSSEAESPPLDPLAVAAAAASKFTSLQPAGIVDLECYTCVHRSPDNPFVMELAGDDQVNPDLRAFYFCAHTDEDSEDWTDAWLNGRHSALLDECDAYKQVCDGFAQQLQVLHGELDDAVKGHEEARDELYRVRSHAEDVRRSSWRLVDDCLDRTPTIAEGPAGAASLPAPLQAKRLEVRHELEAIRAQDMGIAAAVRLLCEYVAAVEDVCVEFQQQNQQLQQEWRESGQSDQARVQELTAELAALRRSHQEEKMSWQSQMETLTTQAQQAQKELKDVQKDLSSTRMEITMNQSQQRNKIAELQQHKKILKKEVIDLRSRLEDCQSELSTLRHQQNSQDLRAEQERQKCELLERYVEKIENQVKVQQNMMELMSQTGSVYGGSIAGPSVDHLQQYSPRNRNFVVVRAPSHDDRDEEGDDVAERLVPVDSARRPMNRRHMVDDVDNKSHMSELTEDRTQRHYEAMSREFTYHEPRPSPRVLTNNHHNHPHPKLSASSPRTSRPPSYIIGMPNTNGSVNSQDDVTLEHGHRNGLATISSAAMSLPPGHVIPPQRRSEIPRGSRDAMSVSSEGRSKLSVAQRARLEAEQQPATPLRVRLDQKTQARIAERTSRSRANSVTSQDSRQSNLIKRTVEAVFGSHDDDGDDDDEGSFSSNENSERSTHVTDYTEEDVGENRREVAEEKKADDATLKLSLQERQQQQRARQIRFLKEQGLIKEGSSQSPGRALNDTSSVASTNVSQSRSTLSYPGTKTTRATS